MNPIHELPIVEILKIGLSGFCFLMAVLGYFLLHREQQNSRPRQVMLASINSYIKKTIILGVIVGIITVSLALINGTKVPGSGKSSVLEFIVSIPEELRSTDTTEVSENIVSAFRELEELRALTKEQAKRIIALYQEVEIDKEAIQRLKTELALRQGEVASAQKDIRTLSDKLSSQQNRIVELQTEALKKDELIRKREETIYDHKREIIDMGSSFLAKISSLNRDIPKFGSSINPLYPFNEEKRKVNMKIQELLAELNFYTGEINGDRMETSRALIEYQKSKGFTKLGYLSMPTTNSMIEDHLKSSGQGMAAPSNF